MTATLVKERPILFSAPMVRAILDGRKTQTRRIVKPHPPDGWVPIAVERYSPAIDDGDLMRDGPEIFGAYGEDWGVKCPYGGPGERLWVREAFDIVDDPAAYHKDDGPRDDSLTYQCADAVRRGPNGERWVVDYRAETNTRIMDKTGDRKWRPSIHMPRWASRITLEIESVRVERVQEISEADAGAEGCIETWTETWWQGYREFDGELHHQQAIGDSPPAWMIEPKKMNMDHLRTSAAKNFQMLWSQKNGWDSWEQNPWVWALTFKRVTP